jgi:leader peptidase (prepilin peptidase)/N-methyltransferase
VVPDRVLARSTSVRRRVAVIGAVVGGSLLALAVAEPSLAVAALTIAALVPAAVVDVYERRLPDALVVAAAVVLAITAATAFAFGVEIDIRSMLAGALVAAGPLAVLHLCSPTAMGFGDVKAAVVIGAALGTMRWELALLALALGAGAASAVGIQRRSDSVAFGPFLVGGAWAVLVGASIGVTP